MRGNRRTGRKDNSRMILYLTGGVLILSIVIFFIIYGGYNNKVSMQNKVSLANQDRLSSLIQNSSINVSQKTEDVVATIDKNIEQIKSETSSKSISSSLASSSNKSSNISSTKNSNSVSSSSVESSKAETPVIKLEFAMPVEGEMLREFAGENLVYSETLQEWITHTAVDIKANKTTVVKAAEIGTVEAIKNDPRYGLTVIVKHENNFKTVYSNLLTAEFVKENEEVEKGQTLGTVGNSASFESADPEHLHFEMIKDGEKVDPMLYIK